jgi:hypothetical protein
MTVYIDLKRWFLITTVCVLGWIFGFAVYWMIAPKVVPLINTELHQSARHEALPDAMQKPAVTVNPAQIYLQEAAFQNSTPTYKV